MLFLFVVGGDFRRFCRLLIGNASVGLLPRFRLAAYCLWPICDHTTCFRRYVNFDRRN